MRGTGEFSPVRQGGVRKMHPPFSIVKKSFFWYGMKVPRVKVCIFILVGLRLGRDPTEEPFEIQSSFARFYPKGVLLL